MHGDSSGPTDPAEDRYAQKIVMVERIGLCESERLRADSWAGQLRQENWLDYGVGLEILGGGWEKSTWRVLVVWVLIATGAFRIVCCHYAT